MAEPNKALMVSQLLQALGDGLPSINGATPEGRLNDANNEQLVAPVKNTVLATTTAELKTSVNVSMDTVRGKCVVTFTFVNSGSSERIVYIGDSLGYVRQAEAASDARQLAAPSLAVLQDRVQQQNTLLAAFATALAAASDIADINDAADTLKDALEAITWPVNDYDWTNFTIDGRMGQFSLEAFREYLLGKKISVQKLTFTAIITSSGLPDKQYYNSANIAKRSYALNLSRVEDIPIDFADDVSGFKYDNSINANAMQLWTVHSLNCLKMTVPVGRTISASMTLSGEEGGFQLIPTMNGSTVNA